MRFSGIILRLKASRIWIVAAAILALVAAGCAVSQPPDEGSIALQDGNAAASLKQIRHIAITGDANGARLAVQGGPELLFSDIRKSSPPSVSFYFPGTHLVDLQTTYASAFDPITEVKTSEVLGDGNTAKITVDLKRDAHYSVEPAEDGLTIVFAQDATVEEETLEAQNGDGNVAAAANDSSSSAAGIAVSKSPKGTRVEAVDFTPRADGIDVTVMADGTINDYSAFAIDNPPRIVFDIYNVASGQKGLQRIAVDSKWVKSVRHFGYPDKLRLVLDTDRDYLTSFTAKPTPNGLIISVAEANEILEDKAIVLAAADTTTTDSPAETPAENMSESSPDAPVAWLNKLEFVNGEGGDSTVSIGTTHAVRYDMERVSDRKLQLKLFNTRIPQYRKRPLITTRFESAVDRVTPVQTSKMKDYALLEFDLRQAVPFEIEQQDNFINVRFAASTIPPKPLETTAQPEWKAALAEGAVTTPASPAQQKESASAAPSAAGSSKSPAVSSPAAAGDNRIVTNLPLPTGEESLAYGVRGEVLKEEGEVVKRLDADFLREKKVYTGEKIALNFYDTDIKNVFRILGEISGENFAIDKDVTGKVTLNFERPVPWDQVLDLVLKMNQLGLKKEDGIFRIATQATLAREQQLIKEELAAARAAEDEQELVTEFFLVSYINARDTACAHLARECKDPNEVGWDSKFSPRGTVSVDIFKNMIIMNDVPKAIERAREIIRILDQVTPQVLIESRIVEAFADFSRDVGFDWGNVSIGSFDLGDSFKVTGVDMTSDNIPLGALNSGSISFGFSKLTGTSFDIIDAKLQVGETEGKSRIISAPKILTLDGKRATIKQGFEIPYQSQSSDGGTDVEFKQVDLELAVTPKVTPDNRIQMVVDLKKDDPTDTFTTLSGEPALTTNSAHTELLMENGETIVIGGIIKANVTKGGSGIPGLRKIPALGFLFGYESDTDSTRELLIFLTPQIVKLAQKEVQSSKF